MKRCVFVLLLAVQAWSPAWAQALPADFARRAEAYVQSWVRDNRFRGTVLVAHQGQPVFRQAYGKANDEWDIANTIDTKFRLGSITKQFTALAILQLVDQGKLKLDDAVKTHYPEAPAAWDKITIHHLLNHTSGIPSYTDQKGFFATQSRDPRKPAEIVKLTQDLPLAFEPGAQFRYNNTGYILLGAILEKVTGRTYEAHLRQTLFEPLGMTNTGYDAASVILKKRASGYTGDGANAPYLDMTLPYAAGSLYSTVDDLLKWDEALHGGRLLSKALWEKMTTPGLGTYGYGLNIRPVEGKTGQSHGGGINGFNTFMIRVPEARLVAIVLANQNGPAPDTIGLALARMYLGADIQPRPLRTEIRLTPPQLDAFAGNYELRPGFVLRIYRDGEKMMVHPTGQTPAEIFAMTPDRFFAKVVDAEFAFERDAAGQVTAVTLHQNGRELKGPRQPLGQP